MNKLQFTERMELINKYDIGYLYIVKAGAYMKIGVSNLPEQRIQLIKTDNPEVIKELLVIKILFKYDTEQHLHKSLKEQGWHYRNEWFVYDSSLIEETIDIIGDFMNRNKKEIKAKNLLHEFKDTFEQLKNR